MTQCNTLIVKSSNSQLNKLKARIKDGTQVTFSLSSNVVADSKIRKVSKICKAFENCSSASIKFHELNCQDNAVRRINIWIFDVLDQKILFHLKFLIEYVMQEK